MGARNRGRHTAGSPIEQPVGQHRFQTLDVNAQPWLGAVLPLGRHAEATFLIGGDEASNLLEIYGLHQGARYADYRLQSGCVNSGGVIS